MKYIYKRRHVSINVYMCMCVYMILKNITKCTEVVSHSTKCSSSPRYRVRQWRAEVDICIQLVLHAGLLIRKETIHKDVDRVFVFFLPCL